jgi:hypothetical protein
VGRARPAIHHCSSADLVTWDHRGPLPLSSDRVIYATVHACPGSTGVSAEWPSTSSSPGSKTTKLRKALALPPAGWPYRAGPLEGRSAARTTTTPTLAALRDLKVRYRGDDAHMSGTDPDGPLSLCRLRWTGSSDHSGFACYLAGPTPFATERFCST